MADISYSAHYSRDEFRPGSTSHFEGNKTYVGTQTSKSGAGGPRITYPWGVWAPARGYSVFSAHFGYEPGRVISGRDSPKLEENTWYAVEDGFPQNGSPITSVAVNNFTVRNPPDWCDSKGFPKLPVNLRNRLITECMVKFGNRQVNVGEAIGESRETLSMLASSTVKLAKALLQLRRGNPRGALKVLGLSGNPKDASSAWLEYQYGWLPLISDIYDAGKLAQNGFRQRRVGQIVSATRQITEQFTYFGSPSSGNYSWEGTASMRARCKLFYRVESTSLDYLSQLGLINPAEIAWALMPWSFVIDWLVPVQTFLEACTATQGLSFIDGSIALKVVTKAEGKQYKYRYPFIIEGTGPTYFRESSGFLRTVVSSPTPSVYWKSPFSTTHAVNALALLQQLRR